MANSSRDVSKIYIDNMKSYSIFLEAKHWIQTVTKAAGIYNVFQGQSKRLNFNSREYWVAMSWNDSTFLFSTDLGLVQLLWVHLFSRAHACVCVCVRKCVCMAVDTSVVSYRITIENNNIYQPLRSDRIWHKVNSLAEFHRFEFRVFLLLDWLPHQGWRSQSALLFTHRWRENNWIHTFPKGISAMWNAVGPFRIWTRIAVSNPYNGNHYTTGTSTNWK